MSQASRQTCALPPFGGLRVCATPGCGTLLSQYNPDDVCAQCADGETTRSAGGIDLERLIAGLLLTHDALHPGEPLNVTAKLAELGIEADCWTVRLIVRHLGLVGHSLIARGTRGRPGYAIVQLEHRYRPVVGFGGVMMERDPESGRYAGSVATGVAVLREAGESSLLQPSLPGFGGGDTET